MNINELYKHCIEKTKKSIITGNHNIFIIHSRNSGKIAYDICSNILSSCGKNNITLHSSEELYQGKNINNNWINQMINFIKNSIVQIIILTKDDRFYSHNDVLLQVGYVLAQNNLNNTIFIRDDQVKIPHIISNIPFFKINNYSGITQKLINIIQKNKNIIKRLPTTSKSSIIKCLFICNSKKTLNFIDNKLKSDKRLYCIYKEINDINLNSINANYNGTNYSFIILNNIDNTYNNYKLTILELGIAINKLGKDKVFLLINNKIKFQNDFISKLNILKFNVNNDIEILTHITEKLIKNSGNSLNIKQKEPFDNKKLYNVLNKKKELVSKTPTVYTSSTVSMVSASSTVSTVSKVQTNNKSVSKNPTISTVYTSSNSNNGISEEVVVNLINNKINEEFINLKEDLIHIINKEFMKNNNSCPCENDVKNIRSKQKEQELLISSIQNKVDDRIQVELNNINKTIDIIKNDITTCNEQLNLVQSVKTIDNKQKQIVNNNPFDEFINNNSVFSDHKDLQKSNSAKRILNDEQKKFINKHHPRRNSLNLSGDLNNIYSQETEKEKLKEITKPDKYCVICKAEYKKYMFEECRHLVSCEKCKYKINDCPICRKKSKLIPIYN